VDRRTSANNDLDSEPIVSEVVQLHPNINAILSLDAMDTVGSYLALKGRSLTGRVKVVGVEQGAELANAVRLKQIDALIAENTYQMGYEAVQLLTNASNRPASVVKLRPLLITAVNIDAPETRPFITNDWRAEVQ
jgi:ribose transport system substrate-binding protein